ncbi:hypothetical protein FHS72_001829 [Loktanella ponticola]|uniref:Transferrin-binding protein B C-lobe/N-lobe beta barrel domain-containing protein n=1 Tax=Yoonia ponticola TaxID=1524255 RepID=A0A7W9BKM8_9RHOB|nr:hypothetical protein [Yoonia ponticola]MBB5722205.1 hypothetical protein [Yoonia ponticola]
MSRMTKMSLSVASLVALAACGGSGGSSSFDALVDRAAEMDKDAERIAKFSGTAFTAMPTSGSASFDGGASIFIDPVFETDPDDIALIGDVTLTANFGAGTMTGAITNLAGLTDISLNSADVLAVSGEVAIGDSLSIIGDDEDDNLTYRPNDWLADYTGDLTIDGDSYVVEGFLNGQFLGTRVNPTGGQSVVKAVVGFDSDGFATVNGGVEEVDTYVEIFGENR